MPARLDEGAVLEPVFTAHPERPMIAPVPPGLARPRWSVMIPTFNCAGFLERTLESVLEQDPGPAEMQIEVVDDYSTRDDPERVVATVGRGRVSFFRQPTNVGHVANFNVCLQRSRGRLVHLLHGDDLVLRGFYRTMHRAFERADIGAAFCRYRAIDEHGRGQTLGPLLREESGVLEGWLERLAEGQLLQAPSMVVRRDVYERLGGFDPRIATYAEDWEMWVRIAAHFPVWFETTPLAVYRMHGSSLSGDPARLRQNMRDLRIAMRIIATYLPAARAAEIQRTARRATALALVRRARRRFGHGQLAFPWTWVAEAIAFERSPAVAVRVAVLVAHWLAESARQAARRVRVGAGVVARSAMPRMKGRSRC